MGHCLEHGGERTKPPHFKLMMACAEICLTSAHFMLIGLERHKHVCRERAEICAQCAEDCVGSARAASTPAAAAPIAAARWPPNRKRSPSCCPDDNGDPVEQWISEAGDMAGVGTRCI
jgi:hypothetical protein